MADTPIASDLAAHATAILAAQARHNQVMAQVAAEHANPVPLTPEPQAAK